LAKAVPERPVQLADRDLGLRRRARRPAGDEGLAHSQHNALAHATIVSPVVLAEARLWPPHPDAAMLGDAKAALARTKKPPRNEPAAAWRSWLRDPIEGKRDSALMIG